eukprot:TRINITY_DN1366_c3_g2_i1.p1 TRINITY_DN1366_c3_g2~~TRINITY_DN1366_c3_g2_i1.p1  ORF type:complete len:518 (+),score=58.87 TRINITY_DN1366_c3_g2_i1:39-1592(+)
MKRSPLLMCTVGQRASVSNPDGTKIMKTKQSWDPNPSGRMANFLKLCRKLRWRNILRIASTVQSRRDWIRVGICLRMRELETEGVSITDHHIREFEKREMASPGESYTDSRTSHQKLLKQIEQALRAEKEARLPNHLGFSLEVKPSSLPTVDHSFKHGNGLFAKGDIQTGTVATLVPGMVWQGAHKMLRAWATDSEGNPNRASPYIHFDRLDLENAIIDSDMERYIHVFGEKNATDKELKVAETEYHKQFREYMTGYDPDVGSDLQKQFRKNWMPVLRYLYSRWTLNRGLVPFLPPKEWAKRRAFQSVIGKRAHHGFSSGNVVNHCGATQDPNVMFVPVSIPTVFPVDLLPYLPYQTDPALKGFMSGGTQHFLEKSLNLDDRDKMQATSTSINHARWGGSFKGASRVYETEFLLLVPALAVVTTRRIADGEELLANHRFNPHKDLVLDQPTWYQPHPDLVTETYLHNNLDPPKLSLFKKWVFGCVDPEASFADMFRNPKLINRRILFLPLRFIRKYI